ncbi:hypothetical protein B0T11DRAFT_294173 [Plectosphaerella cucumerina]|uniref:Isopenicillin N synthase-like Fe(2+) 2OG dioxygenase domain-containing protein n=1 Tax=Plectosphaerella cucumerina TaxID=40658 RepID=A0A8K0XAL6_9PEZI|nr:hypothetical protein B0T11DRAFT_294173 [Plectosphaerella cucumerina]
MPWPIKASLLLTGHGARPQTFPPEGCVVGDLTVVRKRCRRSVSRYQGSVDWLQLVREQDSNGVPVITSFEVAPLKRRRHEESSGDHLRYIKRYHGTAEENQKLGGVWLKGRCSASPGQGRFLEMVRPQRDALTVNIADALQFMTNGYLKLSIHRVVAPPPVQAHINRLGVLYMVRIEDDTNLVPVQESPVLQRLGLLENKTVDSDGKPVKARKWPGDNEEIDVEIIKGVKVKYYD